MPNLVHSLDAASLIRLYYAFYNFKSKASEIVNFYSIHDCFAVTANDVETLIHYIRTIYIEIYSNEKYIKDFDRDILNVIFTSFGKDHVVYNEKERTITISCNEEFKVYDLPKLPFNVNIDHETITRFFKRLEKAHLLIN
jgi:DNA-directed RNA polymerase